MKKSENDVRERMESEIDRLYKESGLEPDEKIKKKFVDEFQKRYEDAIRGVDKTLAEARSQRESYGLFLAAIMFGVFGGMLSAIMDRHLSSWGLAYELLAGFGFLLSIIWLIRNFERKISKHIMSNEHLAEMSKLAKEKLSKRQASHDN